MYTIQELFSVVDMCHTKERYALAINIALIYLHNKLNHNARSLIIGKEEKNNFITFLKSTYSYVFIMLYTTMRIYNVNVSE